jgi:curli biogenesis system outer membrane secretion channel CsgG
MISAELQKTGRFELLELMQVEDLKALIADTQGGTYGAPDEAGRLVKPEYALVGRITHMSEGSKAIQIGGIGLGLGQAQANVYVSVVKAATGEIVCSADCGGKATGSLIVLDGGRKPSLLGREDDSAPSRALRKAVMAAVGKVSAAFPKVCPACGETVPGDAKFCPFCGASAEELKCKKCGCALTDPRWRRCPKCNTPVSKR